MSLKNHHFCPKKLGPGGSGGMVSPEADPGPVHGVRYVRIAGAVRSGGRDSGGRSASRKSTVSWP